MAQGAEDGEAEAMPLCQAASPDKFLILICKLKNEPHVVRRLIVSAGGKKDRKSSHHLTHHQHGCAALTVCD